MFAPWQAFVIWYFGLLIRGAMTNYRVNRKLVTVLHLMAPPSAMFAPDMVLAAATVVAQDVLGAMRAKLSGTSLPSTPLQGSS